jgi:hypothetical protein
MKRRFPTSLFCPLLLLLTCVIGPVVAETKKQVIVGTLVDVTCGTDPKRNFSKLRSEHSRKCLLMPVCAASGYALLTDDNQVLQFDAAGNTLARELIDKNSRTQKWRVAVDGDFEDQRLRVHHIKLAPTV